MLNDYCEKVIKKHFNKSLIISVEDEECWYVINYLLMKLKK